MNSAAPESGMATSGKQKTGRRPGRRSQAKLFFGAYFGIVCLVLVWNLLHCTAVTWLRRGAFVSAWDNPDTAEGGSPQAGAASSAESTVGKKKSADEALVLLDGEPLALYSPAASGAPGETGRSAVPAKARLRGVAVYGYENRKGLRFTEETVRAEVLDASTQEVLGSGVLSLKNQSPYPNDETAVYIAFAHPVAGTAGKDLELRLTSAGLSRNGIFFTGGTAGEDGRVPAAGLYYEKKTWNPLTAVFYFLAEMAVGLGGLLLYGERLFPLFDRKRSRRAVPAGGFSFRRPAGAGGARVFLPLGIVLVLTLVCMGTAWLRAGRRIADALDAEVLVRPEDAGETVTLRPGQSLRQRIVPGQAGLAGIGICPAEDAAEAADAVLAWRLLRADGAEVLGEGRAALADLKKVKPALEKDLEDEETLRAAGQCLLLPLDLPVRESSGEALLLELTAETAEGKSGTGDADAGDREIQKNAGESRKGAEAGENERNSGGAIRLAASADTNGILLLRKESGEETSVDLEICLMGAYRNNGFMKGLFQWVCAVLLVSLAAIYVLCLQAEESGPGVARVYLVSALCMGLLFSFVTPAYTVSDERTHIDSVYLLSNRLLGITDIPGPQRAYKRACDIDAAIANTMPVKAARYRAVAEGLFGAAAPAGDLRDAVASSAEQVGAAASGEPSAAEVRTAAPGEPSAAETGTAVGEPLPASGKEYTAAYTRSSLDNVPVLCYLPAAIGFSLARLAGRNMITMVMFARWANLLACAAVMYLAISRLPRGGACLAVIGLFPKTLQQTASCSYDGLVIEGTFLFIACCASVAGERLLSGTARAKDPYRICVADLMVLVLAGFFVASCKGGVYLPVLGLALVVPASFSGKVRTGLTASVLGGAAFLFFGKYVVRLVGMFSRKPGTASIAAGTRTLYTLTDFLHAPAKLVRIFYNTLDVRGDGLLAELVGKNLCQKWVFVFAFLAIAFLGILEAGSAGAENREAAGGETDSRGTTEDRGTTAAAPGAASGQEKRKGAGQGAGSGSGRGLRLSVRLWLLFLTAAGTALIFLSMLLAFTQKGAAYVEGLQGRYFLPLVPLCFLAAQTGRLRREGIRAPWLLYAADVLLAVTFSQIFLAYLSP